MCMYDLNSLSLAFNVVIYFHEITLNANNVFVSCPWSSVIVTWRVVAFQTSLSQGTASAADWATPHWALSGASYTHATQPRGEHLTCLASFKDYYKCTTQLQHNGTWLGIEDFPDGKFE